MMPKSLDGILNKLSHPLPEVRCRALRSLISKLDHGLIHESNLVPERSFIVKFLEWFNFDSTPMSEDVLQLLRRLSAYENARLVLLSLGGVEFFSKLRNDVAGTALHDIDAILKYLTNPSASTNGNHYEQMNRVPQDSRFFSKTSSAIVPDVAASYLAFPGFPWHFLTATDRHVLTSTSTSLSSSDPALVENACSFLLDVVLHDFPAEIFLQRPTIINTLLILLRSGADISLLCIACKCLSLIARNLAARILSYQDPDFHCPRQGLPGYYSSIKELTSQYDDSAKVDSDGWERNGGDGRDGTVSSSLSSEYDGSLQLGEQVFNGNEASLETHSNSLDDDSFLASQLSQLSVIEFTFSSLQAVADVLNVDSPILFFDAYEVACNCVEVLSHLFNVKALWNEDQGVCDGVRTRIKLLSGVLSRCVLHHSHLKCDPESEIWKTKQFRTTKDSIFHRIAFQVCSVLFLRFLRSIITDDRIVYLSSVKSTENVLLLIASDQAFKISSPDLHCLSVMYLKHFEARQHLAKLQGTLASIQCIQNFRELSAQQGDYKSLLMQAEGSVNALPFYNPDGYVSQVISLISLVNPSYGEFHCEKAKSILIKLLCHNDLKVRNQAYSSCQKVMLKLFENVDDSSAACSGFFMINNDALHELVMHGLSSNSSVIKNAAHDIVMSLLRGKYFMEEQLWQRFLDKVQIHLPALQSYAGESEILRKIILDFMNTNFGPLPRLVSLLRFLILKSRRVRSCTSPLLLEFLSCCGNELLSDSDDKKSFERLLNCLRQMDDFTDRLVVNDPLPIVGNKSLRSLTANEELILQILSVLRSRETSKAKRLATFQQLAFMLSVKESHVMFLKNDGLRIIKQHLCQISSNSILTKHENDEASSCILIMLKVSAENDEVRKLLLELPTLLCLLRFVVFSHNFSDTSNLASQVLTILIMRDVLTTECANSESVVSPTYRLSSRLISHYHIALPCSLRDVISSHHSVDAALQSLDPLDNGPAAFAVALGITLVQNHADVQTAITSLQDESINSDGEKSNNPVFQRIALLCSSPDVYLEEFTSSVSNARMHASVSRAVCLLRTLLLTYPQNYLKAMLNSEKWRFSLESFVLVHPSSTDDIKLLCDVVSLLSDVVSTVPSSQLSFMPQSKSYEEGLKSTLIWYIQIVCGCNSFPDIPLLNQLKSPSLKSEQLSGLDPHAKEQRRLCKSILSMMSHISATILVLTDKSIVHKFQATLCRIILLRLKLANTPRYYDLPSMEVTLDCLLRNTAACAERNRSALFFYDDDSMPVQLMSSLFEVVSAFHIENSGSSMSYMGRGVSKSATQNIVNIVFGAANQSNMNAETFLNWLDMVSQGFPISVKLSEKYAAAKHKKSYKWILALWPARDPLIRYCGLLLTSMVTRTADSCSIMQEYFKDYPGGIWRVLLSVLFDSTECSAVRTEAAYVCCNLVTHYMRSEKPVSASDFAKVLKQYGFYQGCSHILSQYYPCSWVKPSSLILYPHMYPVEITSSYLSEETPADGQSTDTQSRRDSRSQFGNSSNASEFPPEWEASVTPNLVAAMCHLLSNIFNCFGDLDVVNHHADIAQNISALVDAGLLETVITKFNLSENIDISKGRLQFLISSLVKCYAESCRMIHIYMSYDDSGKVFQNIINNTNALSNIVCLATSTVAFAVDDSHMIMHTMDLLSYFIVNCSSSQDVEILHRSVMAEWNRFHQCTKVILGSDRVDIALKISSITLMTNVASLVDSSNEDEKSEIMADIVELCDISIDFLKACMQNKEHETFTGLLKCSYALQSLFVFQQCRINAVESGFLAYLIGEMNSRILTLIKQHQNCSEKMKKGKNYNRKNHVTSTLSVLLRIISSLLIYTTEVQVSAFELGLNRSLQNLWKWKSGASELKSTLIKVAICYTASCEETSASLATCQSGKDCFMSYIISETQEMNKCILNNNKVHQNYFKDLFRLLRNLSISKECRSMLWKGGFLMAFSAAADRGRHPRCTKQQQSLLQQWLKLMHCLSFFPDGQLNILKIQDVLVILHGIYSETEHSEVVFKILVNMCYNSTSKARISSNPSMIAIITSEFTKNSCCQAVSALRALLFGCQKSKVFLKDARLSEKIVNAQDSGSADQDFQSQANLLLKELEE